jgi:F1F0 ATPase subunit 2
MAMHDVISLAAVAAEGGVLGTFFFGGLWCTVRKGMSSEWPALWFFGSLMARVSIVLLGFYVFGQEDWTRWLLCLIGFVLARLAVWWFTQTSRANWPLPVHGAGHAP